MITFRNLMVSLAVLFVFMFCFGTSLQAASVEETVELVGPETAGGDCDGDNVGRASIEHRAESLAERIVGRVFDKDKSDDSLTITVRTRPRGNAEELEDMVFNVFWFAVAPGGNCYDPTMDEAFFLGTITTDDRGRGRARFQEPDGNKSPGDGVTLVVCKQPAPDDETCDLTDGLPSYTAIFTKDFPPGP